MGGIFSAANGIQLVPVQYREYKYGLLMADEFPRRLCDPLPPVTAVLYYRWLAAGLHDKIISQGVGGHRVYVGIRHPLLIDQFRVDFCVCFKTSESSLRALPILKLLTRSLPELLFVLHSLQLLLLIMLAIPNQPRAA